MHALRVNSPHHLSFHHAVHVKQLLIDDHLQGQALRLIHDSEKIVNPVTEKVRLLDVRRKYNSGNLSQNGLEEQWNTWKDQDEFIVLQNADHTKKIAMKCSKRGNDVYRFRVKERFREIDSLSGDFDSDIFDANDTDKKSNALFVTLTYDTKLCSKSEAWSRIGVEYNRYISNLKRKFGSVQFIRCFEAFANGYPHIHLMALFDDVEFNVFEHSRADNIMQGSTFRIKEKKQFESWHSNVDVTAVNNMGKGIRYITKYLRKTSNEDNVKYATTQALLWIHGKRSFSVSKEFSKKLMSYRLESKLHNSNKKLTQTDLFGVPLTEKWDFVGVYSINEIQKCNRNINPKGWHFEIDHIPEKMPNTLDKLNKFDVAVARSNYHADRGVPFV